MEAEILRRFGIEMDLDNPYIVRILDKISDPSCFKYRHQYKLGFKTKQAYNDLLDMWSKHKEQYERQPMQQQYVKNKESKPRYLYNGNSHAQYYNNNGNFNNDVDDVPNMFEQRPMNNNNNWNVRLHNGEQHVQHGYGRCNPNMI